MNPALVVISHYNAWPTDHLLKLLDQTQDVPAGHPFRRLVVVNRAVDRDLELPGRHADVEVLYRENTGYNIGAWDHGWRVAAPAESYLFLQEECRIVRPDWLGSSVRPLSRPKVGLVGESLFWPGLTWGRLELLYKGQPYWGGPDEPPIDVIGGIKRFLATQSIPPGTRGEHLQSIILATRRDVLEAIGGFLIGRSKGEAIACEVAISRAVVARGLEARQVGLLPFRYIFHPQWPHLNQGAFTLIHAGLDRYAPLATVQPIKNAIAHLRKVLAGHPYDWEIPVWEASQGQAPAEEKRAG